MGVVASSVRLEMGAEVQVLRPEPGDMLIVTTDRPMSREWANLVKERIREMFPYMEVLVVERGVILKVVRVPAAARYRGGDPR